MVWWIEGDIQKVINVQQNTSIYLSCSANSNLLIILAVLSSINIRELSTNLTEIWWPTRIFLKPCLSCSGDKSLRSVVYNQIPCHQFTSHQLYVYLQTPGHVFVDTHSRFEKGLLPHRLQLVWYNLL